MNIEDLHEMEDSFESYDDNKQIQIKKSVESVEEEEKIFTGTTPARRRIVESDNSVDNRWNKFKF